MLRNTKRTSVIIGKNFWTRRSLRQLGLVNKEIFNCFLQPEYPDNVYFFEKRLHLRKVQYFRSISRLRKIANHSSLQSVANKIDELFDVLMDCAQLRRRVTDHTSFTLCAKDLLAILEEMNRLFAVMIETGGVIDVMPLEVKINQFENTFQHVLQIAAREPLAFLLFISGLKSFQRLVGQYDVLS